MRVRHTGHMADTSVRLARTSDVDDLASVQIRAWTSDFAQVLPTEALAALDPGDVALEWARGLLQPGGHRLLVALVGNVVIGYTALGPSSDPDTQSGTGEVLALEVDPDHRGVGHGSRLLAAVVDTARESQLTDLTLWVPLAAEKRRSFFMHAGWGPDTAYRDLDAGVTTIREVRLVTNIGNPP